MVNSEALKVVHSWTDTLHLSRHRMYCLEQFQSFAMLSFALVKVDQLSVFLNISHEKQRHVSSRDSTVADRDMHFFPLYYLVLQQQALGLFQIAVIGHSEQRSNEALVRHHV